MKNIFKLLSKSKRAAAIIALLLIIQAYCDLALVSVAAGFITARVSAGIGAGSPQTTLFKGDGLYQL